MKYFVFLLFIIPFKFADCQGLKMKLTDHTGNVESVCYSSDGKYLASGSWDGNVNLYTIDSFGNALFKQTFSGHMGAVSSLTFSKNNKYLVSASKDYSTRIWNIDTPARSKVFNLHLEPVTASFLDPANKFLISASLDGTIKVTNVNDSRKSSVIKIGAPIYDLQISKDNKFYFAAVKGNVIKKFQTSGKNLEVESYIGHTDEINAIEMSPDGNYMASASSDKNIMIWDLSTGKSIRKLQGFEWKVTSLKYSTDGKYIAGGCNNGVAKLFEVETGKLISDFNTLGKNVRDVAFSKNGKEIAVATHMDSEKFGVIIYNSGVTSSEAPPLGKATPSKGKTIVKPGAAPAPKKPATKTNGTK
jgi:WD40 repeat protein